MVKAKSGADPSVVLLAVRYRDPREAARIANLWAEIFVRRANEIYGSSGESQLQLYEDQLQRAEAKSKAAQEALVEFQSRNLESVLQNELDSYRQMQADYLADQRGIAYIIQDVRGLREQLARWPADQLTALYLQIRAFEAHASAPIELQVDSAASLSNKSPAEQIAFLDELGRILQEKSAETDGRLAELEPQILALQQQLQEIRNEQDRLTRTRDIAR